jgi:pyrroloquinoline quinone biosynthesis protein E
MTATLPAAAPGPSAVRRPGIESPLSLLAELTYRCVLQCPYCSNPLRYAESRYRDELGTADWTRVLDEAARLGVVQVALSGGEPTLRRDLLEIVAAARDAGLYSTLVTAGTLLPDDRLAALREAGLDHVQVSIQGADRGVSDLIAGAESFDEKVAACRRVRAFDFPLTLNAVLHRLNLHQVGDLLALAEEVGADRIELANTQYHGWALVNRKLLLPSREQLEAAAAVVERERRRLAGRLEIIWVLPDYFEDLPKPCLAGWARRFLTVTPNGDVLPCQAAADIPSLAFSNVRERDLEWIWYESDAFNAFRGTDWMPEPCRSCPLGRQEVDFGGCRCQAFALTGDARRTDPVCRFSPDRHLIDEAVREAQPNGGRSAAQIGGARSVEPRLEGTRPAATAGGEAPDRLRYRNPREMRDLLRVLP